MKIPPELDQLLKIAGEKAAAAKEVTEAATKAESRLAGLLEQLAKLPLQFNH